MRRLILIFAFSSVCIIAAFAILFGSYSSKEDVRLVSSPEQYVTTLVGTLSEYAFSTGNTYPAIALPWGMNFWTPQTGRMGDGWTYRYDAHLIRGFKQTHQPSPWINDYGQFSIMPLKDRSGFTEDDRASWFSHKTEEARPYYYKVYLADHDVTAEVAPTERAAVLRFTYPDSEHSGFVVDAFDGGSYIKVLPDMKTIVGYTVKNSGGVPENFRNWFVVKSSVPFEEVSIYDGATPVNGTEAFGDHMLAVAGFRTDRGDTVLLGTASSFISLEQAMLNLEELGDNGFEAVKEAAASRWRDVLSRISVGGGTEEQYRTFYSCLYRSLLFPRKFYEMDATGTPVHYSPYNGEICEGYMYTDTGFWDTFRALFPLLNLVYPSVNAEIQEGLANAFEESGFLPEWASPGHRGCMIGNNSASVVADAALKGVNDDELETLYQALLYDASHVHPRVSSTGRLGHEYYDSLGYVPYGAGINESVARTLEYAYADWCIFRMGQKLGKPEAELEKFRKGALNYRNLFDPSTKLMRARTVEGRFVEPFSPYKWGDAYTEGNAWHYTWSVFHDIEGLIGLMGGRQDFVKMLDSLFVVPPVYDDSYYGVRIHEITEMQVADMGNYAHGNQPAQHVVYLYDYAGQPWKTQYWAREVMDRLYSAAPDGYCGDEDNGQTSAWYVLSSLGFYPVCPASDEYAVGSPLFRKAVITLENGNEIVMDAENNAPDRRYISDMFLNGKEYGDNFLLYDDLVSGAELRFEMSSEPDTLRGTAPENAPYSFSMNNL